MVRICSSCCKLMGTMPTRKGKFPSKKGKKAESEFIMFRIFCIYFLYALDPLNMSNITYVDGCSKSIATLSFL